MSHVHLTWPILTLSSNFHMYVMLCLKTVTLSHYLEKKMEI